MAKRKNASQEASEASVVEQVESEPEASESAPEGGSGGKTGGFKVAPNACLATRTGIKGPGEVVLPSDIASDKDAALKKAEFLCGKNILVKA